MPSDNSNNPGTGTPGEQSHLGNLYNLNTRRGRAAAARHTRQVRKQQRQRNKDANREEEAALARQRQEAKRQEKDAVRCRAQTKAGRQCKARAVTDEGLCTWHSSDAETQRIMMEQATALRRRVQAKPHELMRTVIESNPVAFMQPYLDALGIRIVYVPDPANPDLLHPVAVADPTSKGQTLFGISKDGQVVVSDKKDLEAQQRAAERLFDRVYGRPKQTNIIAGVTDNDPTANIVPFDDKRQAEIAAILEAAKKPSHATLTPEQLN